MKNLIDPKIKRLFPWVLFLVVAGLLASAAALVGQGNNFNCYPDRYQAIFDGRVACVHPSFEDRAREFFNAPGEIHQ
jgi:hypothetical protein